MYLNVKTNNVVETVDEIVPVDYSNNKEYRKDLKSIIGNYHMMGQMVYVSKRCTNDWKNR